KPAGRRRGGQPALLAHGAGGQWAGAPGRRHLRTAAGPSRRGQPHLHVAGRRRCRLRVVGGRRPGAGDGRRVGPVPGVARGVGAPGPGGLRGADALRRGVVRRALARRAPGVALGGRRRGRGTAGADHRARPAPVVVHHRAAGRGPAVVSDVEAIRSFLRDKGVSPADIDTAEAEGSLHLLVLEHLILPEPPVYTPVQVAERVGMPLERVRQYWRNLGFPDVPDDTVAFTDYD